MLAYGVGSAEFRCEDLPQRRDPDEVSLHARAVARDRVAMGMLEACPGPSVILNDRRQILAANRAFLRLAAVDAQAGVIGLRPGDAVGCREALEGEDGCGSAEACRQCGAGRGLARIEAGEPGPFNEECLLTRRGAQGDEPLELRAGINPIPGGMVALVLQDISDQKRRRVLERCFFHDVLNSAGSVEALAGLAAGGDAAAADLLVESARTLVEEVRSQQTLIAAENGELRIAPERVAVAPLCVEIARTYARQHGGRVRVAVRAAEAHVLADRAVLHRVVGNLVKNAIEAVRAGDVVISVRVANGRVTIAVANPGIIPAGIRRQIFRRSFSTKSEAGRGIGTWSVKLLTETYLGGTVGFSCSGGITEFAVDLPAA